MVYEFNESSYDYVYSRERIQIIVWHRKNSDGKFMKNRDKLIDISVEQ